MVEAVRIELNTSHRIPADEIVKCSFWSSANAGSRTPHAGRRDIVVNPQVTDCACGDCLTAEAQTWPVAHCPTRQEWQHGVVVEVNLVKIIG